MEWLLIWAFLCIIVGVAANARGRSGIGWFLLSLIISPLFGVLFLIAFPVRDKAPSTMDLLLDARRKDEHPDGPIKLTPGEDR